MGDRTNLSIHATHFGLDQRLKYLMDFILQISKRTESKKSFLVAESIQQLLQYLMFRFLFD